MKRHHSTAPGSERRPGTGSRHIVAAYAVVAAGLSCAVFVTLFHAPMPVDAFAALGQQIAATGSSLTS